MCFFVLMLLYLFTTDKQIIIIFFVVLIITALICLGTMFVFVVVIYFGYQKQTKRLVNMKLR